MQQNIISQLFQGENLLKLPEMTYQLNEIKIPKGRKKIPKTRYPVCMAQKLVIKAQNQDILYTKIEVSKKLEGHVGIVIPDEEIEDTELKLSSAVVKVGKNNEVQRLAINLNDQLIMLPKNKQQSFNFYPGKRKKT